MFTKREKPSLGEGTAFLSGPAGRGTAGKTENRRRGEVFQRSLKNQTSAPQRGSIFFRHPNISYDLHT
jgi:hypothetical protein